MIQIKTHITSTGDELRERGIKSLEDLIKLKMDEAANTFRKNSKSTNEDNDFLTFHWELEPEDSKRDKLMLIFLRKFGCDKKKFQEYCEERFENIVSKRPIDNYEGVSLRIKVRLCNVVKPSIIREFTCPSNVNFFDLYDRILCPILGQLRGKDPFLFSEILEDDIGLEIGCIELRKIYRFDPMGVKFKEFNSSGSSDDIGVGTMCTEKGESIVSDYLTPGRKLLLGDILKEKGNIVHFSISSMRYKVEVKEVIKSSKPYIFLEKGQGIDPPSNIQSNEELARLFVDIKRLKEKKLDVENIEKYYEEDLRITRNVEKSRWAQNYNLLNPKMFPLVDPFRRLKSYDVKHHRRLLQLSLRTGPLKYRVAEEDRKKRNIKSELYSLRLNYKSNLKHLDMNELILENYLPKEEKIGECGVDTFFRNLRKYRNSHRRRYVYDEYCGDEELKDEMKKRSRKCDVCGTTGNVVVCGGCSLPQYCGKKCQIEGWKTHKLECRLLL